MTVFYLDFTSGNDSNDGTTFAKRWKTITAGATAARVNPGDTIRIMKSPDAASIGTATWTNGLNYVTLDDTTLSTTVDNCDSAWTQASNVTQSLDTTNHREGTGCVSLAIAAGFTTGTIGYRNTGTLNLSTYQQVSFWIRSSVAITSGFGLTLNLCDDINGANAVNTIPIPSIPVTGVWQVITWDAGTGLGSSIESVSLACTSDPGTPTILIDNIIASKAASINLSSLISKNTGDECWYPILSINGTNNTVVTLDNSAGATLKSVAKAYWGTSENITTYIREGIKAITASLTYATAGTAWETVQDSGIDTFPITFSGGWDTTAMTDQTGDTFVDGQSCGATGITATSKSYVKFEKIHMVRFSTGLTLATTSYGNIISGNMYISGCTTNNVNITGSGTRIDNLYTWGGGTSVVLTSAQNTTIKRLVASGGGTNGISFGGAYNCEIADYFEVQSCGTSGIVFTTNTAYNTLRNGIIRGNRAGITYSDANNNFIYNCTQNNIVSNGTFDSTANWTTNAGWAITGGAAVATGSSNTLVRNENPTILTSTIYTVTYTISAYTSGTVTMSIGGTNGTARNSMGTYTEILTTGGTTQLTFTASSATLSIDNVIVVPLDISFSTVLGNAWAHFYNYNQTANAHRILSDGVIIYSETGDDRRTASGMAWKISSLGATRTSNYPIIFPIATIQCSTANVQKTLTAYIKRVDGGVTPTAKLYIPGGQIAGVTDDVTTTATGSNNVYQQETINFTPTETGIVNVYLQSYGAGTFTVYIDDIGIT